MYYVASVRNMFPGPVRNSGWKDILKATSPKVVFIWVVAPRRNQPTFQRCLLFPSSGNWGEEPPLKRRSVRARR